MSTLLLCGLLFFLQVDYICIGLALSLHRIQTREGFVGCDDAPQQRLLEEAARLAKLRLKVNAAALRAFRGSVQYDQRFDPLLYKPTAPTNLDIYDHNAGEQRSTGEILQIKQEMVEGFEEGASGVVSAPSSGMDPLPEGWWDLPQMPWTPQDYAEREQKAKDGTWRRAFNSGIFFVTGVHVSRRDARAAARAATVAARID
ncbi:hypothetical protein C8F04DRAFT_1253910 [Mycena alexandri]|uniref:Uncharacterized protein n=1 Tax=Mycena alexandri TaxID=1745969 RepID=A0AAD6T6A2_9AGAR|nr:hypothetical protein C8F04DRAFT_1253910 [Mycena alexandri]